MWLMFVCCLFFFFKQKTAYEMRISDWSSDVCSSDLTGFGCLAETELGCGLARIDDALDQNLDTAAAILVAKQARRNHPGVVAHQQITGRQQRRQIAYRTILECTTRRRHPTPADGGTPGHTMLPDPPHTQPHGDA